MQNSNLRKLANLPINVMASKEVGDIYNILDPYLQLLRKNFCNGLKPCYSRFIYFISYATSSLYHTSLLTIAKVSLLTKLSDLQ